MTALSTSVRASFPDFLGRRGFVRASDGSRQNGTVACQEGRWLVLSVPGSPELHGWPPESNLGQPGLWRTLGEPDQHRAVFEIHESVPSFSSAELLFDENSEPENALDSCLDWALATADGGIPPGWQPPSRAEIDVLVPHSRLTVVAGTEARQGELILSPGRLAIRFAIVARVSPELPVRRRAWLARLLSETQNHWRLVRIGFSGMPDQTSILAEVDFTGAPSAALEPLLSAGLASLHGAVAWLVESAVLLADASVACRALEFGPCPQTHPSKGINA